MTSNSALAHEARIAGDDAGRSKTSNPEISPDTCAIEIPEVSQMVDHLFRHESGKMVATLARIFGAHNLSLAEDVVQEALLKALQVWSYGNLPKNPSAWILQVAKNLALDILRRERTFQNKLPEIIGSNPVHSDGKWDFDSLFLEEEIKDDPLRLMFVCCHPELPQEAQVALTLKTLCGFGETEIAAAFLTSKAAIAKRLVRARQRIRDEKIPFEIPEGNEFSERLDTVLQALYLLYNEGYKASQGDRLVRSDLCEEAIRLTSLLVEHPTGDRPKTQALLSLMLLHAARLLARVDAEGNLLLLEEQDRSLWDQKIIRMGLHHLTLSACGDEISEFHLQAGIAYCHCTASKYSDTNWPRILELYDMLIDLNPSPVLALNRSVAVFKVRGSEAGLEALGEIKNRETLENYYLWHAVRAEFFASSGDLPQAIESYEKASRMTNVRSEQMFLEKKLRKLSRT